MDFSDLQDVETTCTICYAEFIDPEDLSLHLQQVHVNENQPTFKACQFCPKFLSNLEEYALHIRNTHLVSMKCCKYCTRVFTEYDEYRRHESKHYTYVAKPLYSCSNCQKLYSNIMELELHEFKDHKDSAEGVFINECFPLLSSLLNIKALKFLQSLGDEVVYVCVMCEMTTPDPGQYLDHLKEKDCKSLACNGCSSVYRDKKGLTRHMYVHKECRIADKLLYKQCLECYKMFELKMWRDHTKHCKAIKCKTCRVVFSSMYHLSKHQTAEHPQSVMLESCKYCNREFAGSACLEKHIERAHKHDEHLYKYKCMWCSAIFKHPKRLFAHFYSTHKDLEPYTCKICDKKFKIRKKFTIHIKLDHKSIGYIEFDENYHVFFTDKKSEKPQVERIEDDTLTPKTKKGEEENRNDGQNDIHFENNTNLETDTNFDESTKTGDAEIDGNQVNASPEAESVTENESFKKTEQQKLKSKLKTKLTKRPKFVKKSEVIELDSSDDDKPLVEIKKREKQNRKNKLRLATWNRKKTFDVKKNKKRFICNICKKNCYTFQNYHNHVAMHYKNVTLKCVKCSKKFKSQDQLHKHYSKEHSSSQLTQTLKDILQKRKSGVQANSELSSTEKFQRTIRKVDMPKEKFAATLTEVKDKLSVKNFIESFTGDGDDAPRNSIEVDSNVTMKPYSGPIKKSFLNIKKCNLTHMDFSKTTLSMPVRFRQVIGETCKATIKQIEVPIEDENIYETHFDDDYDNCDRNESIPEVAQEVMLEGTEDPAPKISIHQVPHQVVLPKLPDYNKIHIAHLQPNAPYYKIVKVEDVLNSRKKKQDESTENKTQPDKIPKDIQLPDGTKLITVNPLAHLLGNTPVNEILERSKNKYYKPKPKNFEVAIAKAMLKLDKPKSFTKKRPKAENGTPKKRKRVEKTKRNLDVAGEI